MTISIDTLPTRMRTSVEQRLALRFHPRLPTAADLILTHGVVGSKASLAPAELRGELGACYANSAFAACVLHADDAGWRYCEGYAFSPKYGVVFEHAWLVGSDGGVWETTWRSVAGITYLGMPFSVTQVIDAISDKEDSSLIFGDYNREFSLHRAHAQCCAGVPPK